MKEKYKTYTARGGDIFENETGNLIATSWLAEKVDETRKEGESWLEMFQRTKPERDRIEKEKNERAIALARFLTQESVEGREG